MFFFEVQFRTSPVVSLVEPPLKACGNDGFRISNSVNSNQRRIAPQRETKASHEIAGMIHCPPQYRAGDSPCST
jgi:hypothetical protein